MSVVPINWHWQMNLLTALAAIHSFSKHMMSLLLSCDILGTGDMELDKIASFLWEVYFQLGEMEEEK